MNHIRMMVDSGAFTAWRQGAVIPLKDYIKFVVKNQKLIDSCVNLDVIPGRPGSTPTPAQVDDAAAQGWKNLMTMWASGLNPIAVFHRGERLYWLEKMLGEGCQYIGLGGVALAGDKARTRWIQDIFEYLCGHKSYPHVKVHGFGITSIDLVRQFPWFSVDSISWMKQAVIGSIYVPKWDAKKKEYDYASPPMAYGFSKSGKDGPSGISKIPGAHYGNLGHTTKNYVDAYLQDNAVSPEELATQYKLRVRLNARFFREFALRHKPTPFRSLKGLLHAMDSAKHGSETPPSDFNLVFSVGTYLEYANILREEEVTSQLISYHRVANGPSFNLKKFVRTGWFCRDTRPKTVII